MKILLPILIICFLLNIEANGQEKYDNFKVSVYTRAREVDKMKDKEWLSSTWQTISSQLHVDKIYLETHRDRLIIEEKAMKEVISFFKKQGLEVAGGITFTIDESNSFETYCYSNPDHRQQVQEIIELSASLFDEVILDDFFFTSCKCNLCIESKGDRSWSEYRLEMMTESAEDLIINPAKKINPEVKVVIKYPNWYDHFHELGFNLETQPAIFDGLYTGTETRDSEYSNQHLQQYLGFLIFRYFEHLKPGGNGGGWVDTYGSRSFDRYAEQLWLTIFAKAPEMTLFEYSAMANPLPERLIPDWKNDGASFDYDAFLPIQDDQTMARAAAHALNKVDHIAGQLGTPYGIKSYRPFHSDGEDFLQSYLGMIGIPMEITSKFPAEDDMILLTAQAKKDPDIVEKIDRRLQNGKDVVITSGLLKALQERGLEKMVNLTYTDRKAHVKDYLMRFRKIEGQKTITIPQIEYFTNDSWEVISGMDNGLGWPMLHRASYGEATLYVLTIPDNHADLYALPNEVLNLIRNTICQPYGISLQGPSKISLLLYDNDSFIVESFNDEATSVKIVLDAPNKSLTDLENGNVLAAETIPEVRFFSRVVVPEKFAYTIQLPPHSFKGFKIK